MKYPRILSFLLFISFLFAQDNNPFRQLESELPTPNVYRTASGAPGEKYWQQKVDYKIKVKLLEDPKPKIEGEVTIIYHNNSPHTLEYLWVQLDQNKYAENSLFRRTQKFGRFDFLKEKQRKQVMEPFVGGYKLFYVKDSKGNSIPKFIYDTVMRLDLEEPLKPGQTYTFSIKYEYLINDAEIEGRSGYKFFEEDKNYIFTIAQFYPRMCVYSDVRGWQNEPFIAGEFALEFGDFDVEITVPADHLVTATGILTNPKEVLTATQRERLSKAERSSKPVFIVTREEALENLKEKSAGTKTWKFQAKNVRDFAFASSRRFIWDAASVTVEGNKILTQAFYAPEVFTLWSKYANIAVQHTLEVYSRYSVAYPYPHATTIYGAVWGMEYPMIAFCGGRELEPLYPTKENENEEKYGFFDKYATISVIMHEVGHNFFPMIINNDERQWGWLDEGFNSFLEYLAEKEWEIKYPSRRGQPFVGIDYKRKDNDQPIMTRPAEIRELGNNAYTQVAMALTVLRETVLGREAFDKAFKTYCERWKFKKPEPADFFRTMEDVAGKDLDWFWRAWFFGTDYVDIAITAVQGVPANVERGEYNEAFPYEITEYLNVKEGRKYLVEKNKELIDEFTDTEPIKIQENPKPAQADKYVYQITFENLGGVVSPLPLRIYYEDNTSEFLRIPVETWLKNHKKTTHTIVTSKRILGIKFDPYRQTGDANRKNNWWGIVD